MLRALLCLIQPPLQWRRYLTLLKACLPGRIHTIICHGMNILFDVYASLPRTATGYLAAMSTCTGNGTVLLKQCAAGISPGCTGCQCIYDATGRVG